VKKERGKINAILPIQSQWSEHAKRGSTNIFNFPPMRRPANDKIRQLTEGSTCLLFAYDERYLVGEFKVINARRVSGTEFQSLKSEAFETSEAKFPKHNQWCWIIKFTDLRFFERPLSEDELRRVLGEAYGKSASMRPLHFTQVIDEKLIDMIKVIMLVMHLLKKTET